MPVTALEARIANAIEVIKSGGTVIYPTETVYGLGAAALSDEAVKKVYELKRRSLSMPISLAVSSFEMLHEVAYMEQLSLIHISEPTRPY